MRCRENGVRVLGTLARRSRCQAEVLGKAFTPSVTFCAFGGGSPNTCSSLPTTPRSYSLATVRVENTVRLLKTAPAAPTVHVWCSSVRARGPSGPGLGSVPDRLVRRGPGPRVLRTGGVSREHLEPSEPTSCVWLMNAEKDAARIRVEPKRPAEPRGAAKERRCISAAGRRTGVTREGFCGGGHAVAVPWCERGAGSPHGLCSPRFAKPKAALGALSLLDFVPRLLSLPLATEKPGPEEPSLTHASPLVHRWLYCDTNKSEAAPSRPPLA